MTLKTEKNLEPDKSLEPDIEDRQELLGLRGSRDIV